MIGPILGGAAFLKLTGANANIVFDGNSLVAGVGSSGSVGIVSNQLKALAPFSGSVPMTNIGVGGQTTADMISRGYLADAAYSAGKHNILIAWEGTNSIFNGAGMTGAQAGQAMADYCADRLAAHADWIIALVTTIARQGAGSFGSIAAANAELTAYDNYLKANYRSMGATAVVNIRKPGSPLAIPDYTSNSFELAPYINYEASGEATAHIHLNDAGYAVVAGYVAQTLRRLPRQP